MPPPTTNRTARRPRWRWVLSLRALMVLVLVVGALLGWWVRVVQVRREAVATITGAGGVVVWRDAAPQAAGAWLWLYRRTGLDFCREVWFLTLIDPPGPRADPAADRALRAEVSAAIAKLGRVEGVDLRGGRVTPADLDALARVHLTTLCLTKVDAVDEPLLAAIERLPELTTLRINRPEHKLTAGVLPAVGRLPRLEEVALWGFEPLLAADLKPLKSLTHLRTLSISPAPTDGAALDNLAILPYLSVLDFTGCQATDAQLTRLVTRSPYLGYLALDGSRLTDAGIDRLARLPVLSGLNLASRSAAPGLLTDASLKALGHLPTLATLVLHNGRFTAAGLAALQSRSLCRLDLTTIESVDSATLGRLVAGRTWDLLGLHGAGITDDALPTLAAAVNASTTLDLGGTAVTDAGLAALAAVPLRSLGLANTALTDAGLATLARGGGTSNLVAHHTQISPAGIMAWHAAVPGGTLGTEPVADEN